MDDLKPCPFCGGEGKMGYVRDGLHVHCRLCFASGPSAFQGRPEDASTQERAIAAWNRRAAAIEALQAQLAEARNDAAFVAAQLQAVLDMSPPPQEGILKKRLHELAARKNALAEARDKALEDAAMLMQRHGFGGSAAAIRAMKGERG